MVVYLFVFLNRKKFTFYIFFSPIPKDDRKSMTTVWNDEQYKIPVNLYI